MYAKLSEKEIEFMECWHDPVANIECLIPLNIKASHTWNESEDLECVKIRNYQFAMIDYSYLYMDDPKKSPQENFDLKKFAGTILNIAGRDLGKSFFLIIDAFLTLIHTTGEESLLASCNDEKLKKIANPILNFTRDHPFYEIFKKQGKTQGIKASPIEIETQLGHTLYGRNEKANEPDPGTAFHSIHAFKTLYEEFSYATKKGTEKRVCAQTNYGTIERLTGIPDLRVGSPLGDMLSDKNNQKFICHLPQYVRSNWSEKIKKEKIAKYGGRYSTAYKLNVEAELLEGAYGKWDMERIRKNCLITDRGIKFFEVSKEIFINLEGYNPLEKKKEIWQRLANKINVVRLPCQKIIIASDIGTTGSPSEVGIFFGDEKNKWRYEYQISLFKLTTKEQAYIFDWLYNILGSAFISLDCSNSDGRSIREELIEKKIPIDHLMEFWMQKNLEVGFLKDEKGKVIKGKNKEPLIREENTKQWAVQQLEGIFYGSKISIPLDEKFLTQFSNHFEKRGSSGRLSWGSSTEEHLVDMFLQFALCEWSIIYKKNYNMPRKKRILGVV